MMEKWQKQSENVFLMFGKYAIKVAQDEGRPEYRYVNMLHSNLVTRSSIGLKTMKAEHVRVRYLQIIGQVTLVSNFTAHKRRVMSHHARLANNSIFYNSQRLRYSLMLSLVSKCTYFQLKHHVNFNVA